MRRRLRWLAVIAAIAVIVAGGVVVWLLKSPEPSYDGSQHLPGLHEAVSVRFGTHAVPSISASSIEDLVRAQGWVLASERLWQMDLMRRLASGRLAEVFGANALAVDRYFRTVGLPSAARDGLAALEPRYRRLLQAYADGVNAWISAHSSRLPAEYRISGVEAANWRPLDSLAIGEYMAWINAVNLREELVFLRLAQRVGTRRALELFPTDEGIPAPADAYALPDYTTPARTASPVAAGLVAALGTLDAYVADLGLPTRGAASNAWAVTGDRTSNGQALLANDPHLSASMPSIWYEMELQAPGMHVAGLSLPGIPLILIGHNEQLAWGLTTAMADTQDLFLERVTGDGDAVLRPDGAQAAIRSRAEQITVAGRDTPVALMIRSTSHGVLIDDLLRGPWTPEGLAAVRGPWLVALRTNLDVPGRAFAALYGLNTAETVEEARAAAMDIRHVSQNVTIAHRNGRIGWQVTGQLPNRGRGTGGFPAPGWEPGYGWTGWLPSTKNPGVSDPPSDHLVNANNRTIPTDYPAVIGHTWLAPYRAQRIEAMLTEARTETRRLDAADLAAMQLDRKSIKAQVFLDALRRHLPAIEDFDPVAAGIARDGLLGWNGAFEPDSGPAVLFSLLREPLYEGLFGDELGDDLPPLIDLAVASYGPLEEAVRTDQSSFWDDQSTPGRTEGPAQVWAKALRQAHAQVKARFPDPGSRRLDQLQSVVFPHAFAGQPIIGELFGVGPVGLGGDASTVNVAITSADDPEQISYIPSMRVVYTPADWSGTRGTLPLGQSGHRLSRYRTDQLDDWITGGTHRWPWNGPPDGDEIGRLLLLPPGQKPAAATVR
jgi:penicillin amidase